MRGFGARVGRTQLGPSEVFCWREVEGGTEMGIVKC